MNIYELLEKPNGEKIVKMTDETGTVWFVPLDPANSDYQAYLESLAEDTNGDI